MVKPTRILQVCNTDFYLNRFLRPLVLALVEANYDVHIATEGEDVAEDIRAGCTVYQVTFPKSASPLDFQKSINALRSIIRRTGFKCVNGHNRNASIVARIAAWREGVDVNLYTAHGFYFHDDQRRLARAATIAVEGLLARITDYTLSQSDRDTQLMTRLRLISPSRIETIGNGIDHRKFTVETPRKELEARFGLKQGVFRVVSVGRIVAGKGFSDLIEAFAGFVNENPTRANSELVIVGGNIDADISPAASQVRGQLKEHGIEDKVRITGIVNNVEDYLYASDLFVSASYREGMPRALLEAMCAGLPVIATDIRGSSEIVTDHENGLLYPAHDITACKMAISELYERPELRYQMRQRNRALVLNSYTEDAYTARQVTVIERLVRR